MSGALDLWDVEEWTPSRLDAYLSEPANEHLDWRRFEIVDGALVVSPQPNGLHARVVDELLVLLHGATPVRYRASSNRSVSLGRSYRVPDVLVVAGDTFRREVGHVTPDAVLLAIEVESPSSMTSDRVTKPAQYAAAGIGHYWRVETDPLRLVTYTLDGEVYTETGAWDATQTARITEPFDVTIELGTLLA